MSVARSGVVAVSDCEQQRETLLIMLAAEFSVTAIPAPSAPLGGPEPRVVILSGVADGSAAVWSEAALRQALRRWPETGLVLVDAPPAVAAQIPGAACASWTDPFSVPAAVSQVAAVAPHASPAAALFEALHDADMALRPSLETAQVLAALVRALCRHASSAVASRFLGEQVRELVDRLAWVDWFDESGSGSAADLTRSLQEAAAERILRGGCRGLDFDFRHLEPCILSASPEQVSVVARCLRAALLELPPGTVEVEADGGALRCRHAELPPATESAFAFDVVASLLRRIDARLTRGDGELTIRAHGLA